MIFADSASSNRTALVMANTVATAALLCQLLYVRFKRWQNASRRRSWKNELLIKAHIIHMACAVNGPLSYSSMCILPESFCFLTKSPIAMGWDGVDFISKSN